MTPREAYNAAHETFFKTQYPNAYKDGHYSPPNYPKVDKANGLTQWIVNYLTWSGMYGNRINTQGQFMTERYKGRIVSSGFRPSSTRRGTADIHCIISGRHVSIEVKVGRDRVGPEQLKEAERVRRSGGIYQVIHNPEEFLALLETVS